MFRHLHGRCDLQNMEKVIPKHPIKPNTELSVGYSWCLENAFYLVNLMRPWCVLFTDTPIAWYQSFFFSSLEDEGISCIMSQSDISSQCHSSRWVASRQMDDRRVLGWGSLLCLRTLPYQLMWMLTAPPTPVKSSSSGSPGNSALGSNNPI